MLKPNGAAELTAFTEKSYKETITPIVPGIWHVLGVGHSNAVIIEGRTSVILVDTLDTLERGQKLLEIIRSRTEKPVKTILYTHGHPDHRGGAGAFSGTDPEIIAFSPATPVLKKTEMFQDIQNLRGYAKGSPTGSPELSGSRRPSTMRTRSSAKSMASGWNWSGSPAKRTTRS